MSLAAGALTLVSVGSTVDSLSSAVATGGTAPYTYQWYRSTTSAFTPGTSNILTGQTNLTLNDTGLTASTQYYYKVIATDAGSNTATSSQLGVLTTANLSVLPISDILQVSVSTTPTGAGAYNTANIALFTRDTPGSGFGSAGYKMYQNASGVATDFGTGSYTYLMALSVFSQQPNILLPGGALIIIPFLASGTAFVEDMTASGTPASGTFVLNLAGNFGGSTAAINWNDTPAIIQTKIRAGIESMRDCIVGGTIASGLTITAGPSFNGPSPTWFVSSNSVMTSVPAAVTFSFSVGTAGVAGETLTAALARVNGLVLFFSLMAAEYVAQADAETAAAVVEANTAGQACMAYFVSPFGGDIATGGYLDLFRSGTLTSARGLFYAGSGGYGTLLSALQFMAAYASTLQSVNFNGTNTTLTMNLQQLSTVQPDTGITPTLQAAALAAGADTYVSFQGTPGVYCSTLNQPADLTFNELWFAGALQIAGFNYLQGVKTKVPQTEDGMTAFKTALRQICKQAITNQFLAPGTWTSAYTFGNQALFLQNIATKGFYIYSQPVSTQTAAARSARSAPLVQIAAKTAGAIQQASVLVTINP